MRLQDRSMSSNRASVAFMPATFSKDSSDMLLLLAEPTPWLLCCDRLMADSSPYDLPNNELYWPISMRSRYESSPWRRIKLAVFQSKRLACHGSTSFNCSGKILGSAAAIKASCASMAEA